MLLLPKQLPRIDDSVQYAFLQPPVTGSLVVASLSFKQALCSIAGRGCDITASATAL